MVGPMSLASFLDSLTTEQLADRLDLALEGATLGIWDWDLRDNSVQFDRRWCEMLGLRHEDVPMELSSWESRVHPDDIGACYADIQAYLRGDTPYYENIHRMRHADGHWVYILDRGRVSGWDEAGKAIRFTGTHFDCTATEQARRSMEQQLGLLARFVRDLPGAVALFDTGGRYLAASDAWNAWFGVGETPVGRTPADAGAPLPAVFADALASGWAGERVEAEESVVPSASGSGARTLRWSMHPSAGVGPGALGLVVRFDDVTLANERRSRAEHQARLSSLGEMAGGIAHELNTPLQTLLLHADMARMELDEGTPDPEALQEAVAGVLETARHLSSVVRAMRTLARRTDGEPEALEPVPLREVIHDVRSMSAGRLRLADIDVRIDAPAEVRVSARRAECAQVLLNLLNNAYDAVEGQAEAWVRVELVAEGAGARLSVIDSGPGVPADQRDAILAPFFTTKPVGQGTGLGLSVSRSLARNWGAELQLDADAPATTFSIRFPGVVA